MRLLVTLCLIFSNSVFAQLVDTTVLYNSYEAADVVDSIYYRQIIVTTDSGPVIFSQSKDFFNDPWQIDIANKYVYRIEHFNVDSINLVSDQVFLIRDTAQWYNERRVQCYFDTSWNVTDSIFQNWSNAQWTDSLLFKQGFYTQNSISFQQWQLWDGSQWINNNRIEYYYSITDKDTLIIHYNGDSLNWLPAKQIRFFYDTLDSLVLKLTELWNGTAWENSEQEIFSYGSISTIKVTQNWTGTFWDDTLRRTYYTGSGMVDSVIAEYWINSSWKLDSLLIYEYGMPPSYWVTGYVHDGSNWLYTSFDSTDIYGRWVFYDRFFNTVASQLNATLVYDSSGMLIYLSSFRSTMGGIITVGETYYYRELVNEFPVWEILNCHHDTIQVNANPLGGVPPFTYQWTSAGYISDSSLSSPNIYSPDSENFILTIRDSLGNVFHDSLTLYLTIPHFNLGSDTIVCVNASITFDAGPGFAFYFWQDSTSNQNFTLQSSVPDTELIFVMVGDTGGCIATDSVTVIFDLCSGINSIDNISVRIFPNPARETLSIHSENSGTLYLFDSQSRIVLIKNYKEGLKNISLVNISPGIYFIELNEGKTVRKKIIIE